MKKRLVSFVGLTVFALALFGCGGSPADKLAFKPPKDWSSTPAIYGAQMWFKSAKGSGEVVFLFKIPEKANGKTDKAFDPNFLPDNQYVHGARVEKVSAVTICGNHPARLYTARSVNKDKKDSQTEMLLTQWGKDRYLALYSRPTGVDADSGAEAAIRSVCVK